MGWVALRWPWHAHRPLLLSVTQFNLSGHVAAAARSRKLNSLMQKEYFFFFSYPFMLSIGKQHVLVLWHWHTACLHINVNPKDLWTKRDGTSDFTCVLCLGYNNENDNDEWFHPQCSAEFIPRRSPKNNSAFTGRWNNPSRVDVMWKVKSHESQHRINGNMHICEIHFRICFLCSPRVTQTSWTQVFF